ncbi:MAG: hypothetical protein V4548_12170 [Bacteroidota bacterium]
MTAIAVTGLGFVSCSTDSAELETTSFKKNEAVFSKENNGFQARLGDSILPRIGVGVSVQINGPGDNPIIIMPPKRP